jgi:toxin CcdB
VARFNVYASASGNQYLLDVQADLLDHLTTRVVVPLLPLSKAPKPAKTLNPIFDIGGVQHSMVTQYLSAIRRREIGSHVADLTNEASTIVSALDCLFQGV